MPLELVHQDREWLAQISAGDSVAFERAFRAYHPSLCQFAYRYVRSREVAEELVHEVFAKLWESRRRLDVRDSLKSYLYSAVRNHAISHLRHALVERRWCEEQAQGSPPQDLNDADRLLESQELVACVQRVLDQLPERCRLALVLRWQRQMSYAEVAEAMGISVKTVEIYVGRGLAALRENYRTFLPHR
jgi:RNA polymerase sigma-19 factor, ECF subfamily